MTPQELEAAGLMLFGDQWQKQLAEELQVSDRTLRYWLAGKIVPHASHNLRAKIAQCARQRIVALEAFAESMEEEECQEDQT